MTLQALLTKYGTHGKAAGALALGIERMDATTFIWLPESFRSLVLFKQQSALLKLTAIAAGTSLERLHAEWLRVETREEGVRDSEDLDDGA